MNRLLIVANLDTTEQSAIVGKKIKALGAAQSGEDGEENNLLKLRHGEKAAAWRREVFADVEDK